MAKQATAEPVEEDLNPFSSITQVRTGFMSRQCPFRGLPFRPELDERCPRTVRCVALPVPVRLYGAGAETEVLAHVTPIVDSGSYCETCLHDRVREQEAGLSVGGARKPDSGKRGRRR